MQHLLNGLCLRPGLHGYQLRMVGKEQAASAHIQRINECKQQNEEEFKTTVSKNGLSYGENMLAAGTAQSTYNSWRKVMEEIFIGGCSNICGEVADQKMGQAYRATTSGGSSTHIGEDGTPEKDDPNYIESPYSFNSYTDFKGNILSIQYTLYGKARSNEEASASIMNYLYDYAPNVGKELKSRLVTALEALDKCLNSGKAFVQDPAASVVKDAMYAIGDLDSYLGQTSDWILQN